MKTKLFKRVGLFGVSLATFLSLTTVNADTVCKTYKNYFYFSHTDYVSNNHYSEITNGYTTPETNSTEYKFPIAGDIKKEGPICLKNGSNTQTITGTNGANCVETWTLNQYYENDPSSNGRGIEETYNGNTYTYYESTSGNTISRNYWHGTWYKADGTASTNARPTPSEIPDAIAASVFPTSTTITRSNGLKFTISRMYSESNITSATPYGGWLYAPAVYYVEYEADCEEVTKYKATINYYYWDMVNDKKTTNKVRFEDTTKANPYTTDRIFDNGYKAQTPVVSPTAAIKNCKPVEKNVTIEIKNNTDFTHDVYYKCTYSANIHYCIEKEDGTCVPATDVDEKAKDYSKTGLVPDGKEINVDSPTIKNCKLKKDSDKKVTYSIDKDIEKATDFKYEVRYVCGEEEAPVNPKTGIALIITAWVVGLGALGYSAYYFINARKEENAEL